MHVMDAMDSADQRQQRARQSGQDRDAGARFPSLECHEPVSGGSGVEGTSTYLSKGHAICAER